MEVNKITKLREHKLILNNEPACFKAQKNVKNGGK